MTAKTKILNWLGVLALVSLIFFLLLTIPFAPRENAQPPTEESTPETIRSSPETTGPPLPPSLPESRDDASPLLLVDRILESMELGSIAFNAPLSMNLEDSAEIQLLLSLEQSVEDLRNAVTAAGEKEGARIRVSNRMEARLQGQSFQITAITPEEQAITSKGVTEWKWEVNPTSTGQHNLHLTLTALFKVDGTPARRAIRTFDKEIEVEVTWDQKVAGFAREHWRWLWAAILAPVAGWFWKKRKDRLVHNGGGGA